MPVVLVVGLLVIAGARLASAQQAVDNAATAAARAASLARTEAAAQHEGTVVAGERLAREGITCEVVGVSVDTDGFAVGHAGLVRATVTCRVPLHDLALPASGGSPTVRGSFTSPIDPYRGLG